jgi:hypothetical protein
MSIRENLSEWLDDDALFLGSAEGEFDAAILGVSSKGIVVYDAGRVIECLVSEGMTPDEAHEWFDHNIECAYHGPRTPIYVWTT